MNEQKIFRIISSVAIAASLTVLFIISITIAAELLPVIKNWLAQSFGHHWVGKSILSVVLFAVTSPIIFIFLNIADEHSVHRSLAVLFCVILIGIVVLSVFFLYENFAH